MNASANNQWAKWGMVPLRLAVGCIFLMHGSQKVFTFGISGTADILSWVGIPFASMFAVVLMFAEVGGGLAILLGAFARPVGLMLAFEMVVAIFTSRIRGGFFTPNGFEFELALMSACLTIALVGAGGVSMDAVWRKSPAAAQP